MRKGSGLFERSGARRAWVGAIALLICLGCVDDEPEPEINEAARTQLEEWLGQRGGEAVSVTEASCVDLGFNGDGYSSRPSDDLPGKETTEGCGSYVRIDDLWVPRDYAKQVGGQWTYLEAEDPEGPKTRETLDVCVDGTTDVSDLPEYCPEDPSCVKVGNQFRCCRDLDSNTVECVHEWFWEDGWMSEGCGYGLGTRLCYELGSSG